VDQIAPSMSRAATFGSKCVCTTPDLAFGWDRTQVAHAGLNQVGSDYVWESEAMVKNNCAHGLVCPQTS
jgi:hypothetical protein